MTVSNLLEQPCNKSDDATKLVTSCMLQVPNLLQLRTSSANTTCQQLVDRFITTCLQTCNNLCVFTCVVHWRLKSVTQSANQLCYKFTTEDTTTEIDANEIL